MSLIDDATGPIAALQRPGKAASVPGSAVGRDPWFLNSLQAPAAAGNARPATAAPAHSAVAGNTTPLPQPAPAITAPVTAAGAANPIRTSTAAATPATVPGRNHAAPAQPGVSSATLALQLLAAHGAAHAVQAGVPPVSPRRQRPDPAAGKHKWAREKVSVLQTDAGLEIIARNYFASEDDQARFVATLLATLQAAGKMPQQITFNGRSIWPQHANTASASGEHHAG